MYWILIKLFVQEKGPIVRRETKHFVRMTSFHISWHMLHSDKWRIWIARVFQEDICTFLRLVLKRLNKSLKLGFTVVKVCLFRKMYYVVPPIGSKRTFYHGLIIRRAGEGTYKNNLCPGLLCRSPNALQHIFHLFNSEEERRHAIRNLT